jgi:hypothetical protein
MVAQETRSRSFRNEGRSPQAREWVEEYPFASVTVLFGIGVGVGLMLGHTIAEATGRRLMHQETFTEKLACQIRDLLKNNIPQGIMRQMS